LQNAAGFLQSKIAGRIDCRYTPRLQFVLDKGVQHSLLVGEILEKIRQEKETPNDASLAQSDSQTNSQTNSQSDSQTDCSSSHDQQANDNQV
jgi:ribosome-binding factor A